MRSRAGAALCCGIRAPKTVSARASKSLCRKWLPQSGEELRDYPLFFHYLNLFPDVTEHELEPDIYLPLNNCHRNSPSCN